MSKHIQSISVEGENNIVINEVVGSEIVINKIELDSFLEKYTKELKLQISNLQKLIDQNEKVFLYEKNELEEKVILLKEELGEKEKIIKRIIEDYEGVDFSLKGDNFQDALEKFLEGDIDEASYILDNSQLDQQEKELSDARMLKGNICYINFDIETAEKNYAAGVRIDPTNKKIFTLATFYHDNRKFSKALEKYSEIIEKENSSGILLVKSLTNSAIIYEETGRYGKADDFYSRSLNELYKLKDEVKFEHNELLASTYLDYGIFLRKIRQYKEAEGYLTDSLTIFGYLREWTRKTYHNSIGLCLKHLSIIYMEQGKFHKAERYIDDAINTFNPRIISMDDIQTETLSRLEESYSIYARILTELERYEDAKNKYLKSIQICERLSSLLPLQYNFEFSKTLNNYSILLRKRESFDHAIKILQKSIFLIKDTYNDKEQPYASELSSRYENLGDIFLMSDDYDQAFENYVKSYELKKIVFALYKDENSATRLLEHLKLLLEILDEKDNDDMKKAKFLEDGFYYLNNYISEAETISFYNEWFNLKLGEMNSATNKNN